MRRRIKKKKKTVKVMKSSSGTEEELEMIPINPPPPEVGSSLGGVGTRRFDFKANVQVHQSSSDGTRIVEAAYGKCEENHAHEKRRKEKSSSCIAIRGFHGYCFRFKFKLKGDDRYDDYTDLDPLMVN